MGTPWGTGTVALWGTGMGDTIRHGDEDTVGHRDSRVPWGRGAPGGTGTWQQGRGDGGTWRWQPSTMISFCWGDVRAKTISVWFLRISSSCSEVMSFRSEPCTTQAFASLPRRSLSGGRRTPHAPQDPLAPAPTWG